ncbi:MAG: Hpt domain-containing protein [Deltaproteobacteria bacterium]|nr:Hpt domain-containing protein [Deltaproteobacteria bacterium]
MVDFKWDRDFALEQASDDEELLQELIDLFHSSSAGDLARIKEGAIQEDPVAMGDAAHSIKGAAASLGIEGIKCVAADLERAGRLGDLDGAKALLPDLESLLKQFQASLG